MSFWGIEVKPGKPYTHSFQNGRGRLRISQATLAIGSATQKSLVQCNVGDKSPVLLCALLPDKTESLQLDLEFEEAENVMFSVIGPRGIYLTGYYVCHHRQTNMQDDTESYGEDIANSETQESNRYTDDDEYEDSFINDDEPEPLTPSPVSSNKDDDEEEYPKKKRNGNGGRKRLKKKYQIIESDDDEMSFPEIDDEDNFPISSICKNNKSEASGRKNNKETITELEKETKDNGLDARVLDSNDKLDLHLVDDKIKGKGDQPHTSVPPLDEVVPKSKSKPKKKKQASSKEEDQAHLEVVSNEGSEVKTKKKSKVKSKTIKAEDDKDDPNPNDTGIDRSSKILPSVEVGLEKISKTKKKRKGQAEVKTDGPDNNQLAGNQEDEGQLAIDKSCGIVSKQLTNENQSEEKKNKKKRRKTSKTQEVEENTNMEVEKENKPEVKNEDCGSFNKRTLSNGLVIEDLVTGNSKGKVAALGRKVKVQYIVKLKENGQIIDSNVKSPHKFRLGDKEVIEGLNVSLDGMRGGDKRRITIPPSMSLGYEGTGENIPPNSWLIYDVEMVSVH